MTQPAKQQTNPYSSGSGGANFETRVQAAFVVLMLTGRFAPCLPPFPIEKIKLQGRYAGHSTDDCIVFVKCSQTEQKAKLLAQVKHEISITANDRIFAEVIQNAWNDFISEDFNGELDSLALITGPLSATDVNNVRPILEWARYSEAEEEFLLKVNSKDFSSKAKREKLEAFKSQLKVANGNTDVTNQQLWEFLKAFHLLGYDLDTESGGTLSLLYSLLALCSNEDAYLIWSRIVDAVQTANQNAGTLSLQNLPNDITSSLNTVDSSGWTRDANRLKNHGDLILKGINTTVGEIHIEQADAFAQLLDMAESSSFVFVTGERGSGKSSLIRKFSAHIDSSEPVFCLRAEDLNKPHLDNVFSAIGLTNTLGNLEASFALMPKKFLILESLEKILELEHEAAFRDLLNFVKSQEGWTVIATGRDYAHWPLVFEYLRPSGIDFKTLSLEGFSDEQVQELCKAIPVLQKLSNNRALTSLLKSPFFANLAYRVLKTGAEFTPQDGEREFRRAVWKNVIRKEHDRTRGMPAKRERTFVDMAVKRAKQMVYGIPEDEFDSEIVFKLEEDNLVRRDPEDDLVRRDPNASLVSPAHDVLEDWALEQFIDNSFHVHASNLREFLDAIGHEPAMNRAFRLWLHRKLRFGDDISNFVQNILTDQKVERYWQDATIAAILQGENPDSFLEMLSDQLLENEGELLVRFCFILRIACQAPYQSLSRGLGLNQNNVLVDVLFLKPFGNGWQGVIRFAFQHRERLSKDLLPHLIALLHEWSSILKLSKESLDLAREVGLLALHLLDDLKNSHRNDSDRKKLLSVIIKTASANREEFMNLLETDILIKETGRRRSRPPYADEFCKLALYELVDTGFFVEHFPDTLIRLAELEWFFEPLTDKDRPLYKANRIEVAECFGLHEYRHDFFPASGMKGPFASLLQAHPKKGLDFILRLLNRSAQKYAHSTLDVRDSGYLKIELGELQHEPLDIYLNDGTIVRQHYSGRLWSAYRGYSGAPYLLQSALMALENWLINYVKDVEVEDVSKMFDYILRNSNSVMTTAILASVATGFSEKVGKAALPLLRTFELYFMDSSRALVEQVSQTNDFVWSRDPYAEIYAEERKTANTRPWRSESLETLIVRLQCSEKLRDSALAAIDMLRASKAENERTQFLLHRIDSRGWEAVPGPEKNTIAFRPKNIEPSLVEVEQKTQKESQETQRFLALSLWATKTFERKIPERIYYESWTDALVESKKLLKELKAGKTTELALMQSGGIVKAAAVFLRDYSEELSAKDVSWCGELISQAVSEHADAEDSLTAADKTDQDGAAASASVLPILLDFASDEDGKLRVEKLIITALTHVNENVRLSAALGIRESLWQRDAALAQKYIEGTIEYARFAQDNLSNKRQHSFYESNRKSNATDRLQKATDRFREQFARGELTSNLDISFRTHSAWHILTPCLMIPEGSVDPEHVALLSRMLDLFFKAEQTKRDQRSEGDEFQPNHTVTRKFAQYFANYLLPITDDGFPQFAEQLRTGCQSAPDFIDTINIYLDAEAERKEVKKSYWQFWEQLSEKVQEIALELAHSSSNSRRQDYRRTLVRSMLKIDGKWGPRDFENQDIAFGKDLILEFVANAGENPDVFEALAKLMHYFPKIFLSQAYLSLQNIKVKKVERVCCQGLTRRSI